jgi:molybdopterin biosynthesis enzyme
MVSGVPSGGDRLARAKKTAQMWLDDEREFEDPVVALWHVQGRVLARDVLALVEIAEAARELMDSYGDPTDEAYGLGGTFTAGGDYVSKARCKTLRSALARLDSGAAE